MPARTLAALLLVLPRLLLGAQSTVPSLLLLTKEKVLSGKMVAYDTNESRIAATCARMRCPHAYLALRPIGTPDEIWWLNECLGRREELADGQWQNHPSMKVLRPLGLRKDSLRQVLTTTLLRRIAEGVSRPPWSIAGTRFLLFADAGEVAALSGSVFEAPDGHQIVIAAAADLSEAQQRAAPFGRSVSILAVERRWSFPSAVWISVDSVFWRPPR
jgi:hypothetical protein